MYLIQQTTKQPTDEILGFFYDFGKAVLLIGVDNMEGRSIRKDIQDVYPGTAIPFKLLVKAWGDWDYETKSRVVRSGSIEVIFPDNAHYIKTEEMLDVIMERQLLGGSSLPDFEKPKSRTPKMYKDLIQEVLKKHGQNLLDSGHSRTAGSTDSALEQTEDGSES